MTQRATKELILRGAEPRPYIVESLGGAEVLLRPLSAAEGEEVIAAQVSGLRASQAMPRRPAPDGERLADKVARARGEARAARSLEIEFPDLIRGYQRAYAIATAYGLVDPPLTLAEVQEIRPASVVEEIGKEVMVRSGIDPGQRMNLAAFRELTGGAADPGDPLDGGAAGPDDG